MSDLFGSNAAKKNDYDASSIEVLEGLEPVRKRPGMYIGGTDERALHHLAGEILDNSMDEAVAGHADWIEISLEADYSLVIRDNGRGIPIDPRDPIRGRAHLPTPTCHWSRCSTVFGGRPFLRSTLYGSRGVHHSVSDAWHFDRDRLRRRPFFVVNVF